MDIAILCGGYGTRLAGLWDSAKCLVPLGDGRPILHHILVRVHKLRPQHIYLLTGDKDHEVVAALRNRSLLSPKLHVMWSPPGGTAVAVRDIAYVVETPLMVLNGDTLPRYDLEDLARIWLAESPDVLIAHCGSKPAGAAILGAEALNCLAASSERDLATWLEAEAAFDHVMRVGVTGFLDVGTPHGFELGRRWK